MDGDEFQEADILWPEFTPRDEVLLSFAPSEPHEALSVPSCAPAFGLAGRRLAGSPTFFLAGVRSPSAATADDEDEWQEADVLWPATVGDGSWRGGGDSLWSFRGAFGRAGRRVKPAAASRREDGWAQGVSSPIDIPANGAARRLVGAAVGRRL